MNNLKKLVVTSVLTISMIIGSCITASAYVSHPSGGTWKYGLVNHDPYFMAYSYYYHASRYHTSTVQLGGSRFYSGRTRPGKTSLANSSTMYKKTNAYYWYNSRA